jgi:hypothetical protein
VGDDAPFMVHLLGLGTLLIAVAALISWPANTMDHSMHFNDHDHCGPNYGKVPCSLHAVCLALC